MSSDARFSESAKAVIQDFRPSERTTGLTDGEYTILDTARECDRLQNRIVRDAALVAAQFAEFSRRTQNGWFTDAPNSTSSLRDVDTNTARFFTLKELLRDFVRVQYGKAALEQFDAALKTRTSVER